LLLSLLLFIKITSNGLLIFARDYSPFQQKGNNFGR
jgi:hypothetical protein